MFSMFRLYSFKAAASLTRKRQEIWVGLIVHPSINFWLALHSPNNCSTFCQRALSEEDLSSSAETYSCFSWSKVDTPIYLLATREQKTLASEYVCEKHTL